MAAGVIHQVGLMSQWTLGPIGLNLVFHLAISDILEQDGPVLLDYY